MNEDGTSNNDQMKVEVPMLAIVPVPNFQIDEVAVLFDMEVKQSESSQTELDANLSAHATVGFSFLKVSVSGSVSAHSSNTRSSDNSAKYNVSVTATNHGTPEGLARVLDMMAANVAPSLISSEVRDADGIITSVNWRIYLDIPALRLRESTCQAAGKRKETK